MSGSLRSPVILPKKTYFMNCHGLTSRYDSQGLTKPFPSLLWCFFAAASSGVGEGFEGAEMLIDAIVVV